MLKASLQHPCESPKNITPHATASQLPGSSCGCCHSVPGSGCHVGTHTTVPSQWLARLQAPKPSQYQSASPTAMPKRQSFPSQADTPTCKAMSQQDTGHTLCSRWLQSLTATRDLPPICTSTQCPSTAPTGLGHMPWHCQPSHFTPGNPVLAAA